VQLFSPLRIEGAKLFKHGLAADGLIALAEALAQGLVTLGAPGKIAPGDERVDIQPRPADDHGRFAPREALLSPGALAVDAIGTFLTQKLGALLEAGPDYFEYMPAAARVCEQFGFKDVDESGLGNVDGRLPGAYVSLESEGGVVTSTQRFDVVMEKSGRESVAPDTFATDLEALTARVAALEAALGIAGDGTQGDDTQGDGSGDEPGDGQEKDAAVDAYGHGYSIRKKAPFGNTFPGTQGPVGKKEGAAFFAAPESIVLCYPCYGVTTFNVTGLESTEPPLPLAVPLNW
jgi:hypothetical protein